MNRAPNRIVSSLAVVLLAGCGLTGMWRSQSLDPEIARDEFRVVGVEPGWGEFTRATVDINQDGTYSAEVYYGQYVEQSTGTWEADDEKVTFVDSKGRSQTYHFDLSDDHKELELSRPIEGTEVTMVLERQ